MPDEWFQVPGEKDGNKVDPKYIDGIDGIDGFTGNTISESPRYVIRVFGTSSALDELRSNNGVASLSRSEVKSKFSNEQGVASDSIDDIFKVGL